MRSRYGVGAIVRFGRTYSDQEKGAFYGAFMAQALLTSGDRTISDVHKAADVAWTAYVWPPNEDEAKP